MKGSPLSPIQTAINNLLENDADLMQRVQGIYDYTPENENYPYVVIGGFNSDNWDTYESFGRVVFPDIYVYSNYPGKKEVQDIQNDIIRILALEEFPIGNDWENVGCMLIDEDTRDYRSSSGSIIQEGYLLFRLWVQEAL